MGVLIFCGITLSGCHIDLIVAVDRIDGIQSVQVDRKLDIPRPATEDSSVGNVVDTRCLVGSFFPSLIGVGSTSLKDCMATQRHLAGIPPIATEKTTSLV